LVARVEHFPAMKSIYLACALSLVVGISTAFADGTNTASPAVPAAGSAASDSVAVIKTTDGTMVVAFWPKEAPNTVANFEKLANQGFYDGTAFHRIIKGFMVQGGDPLTKDASQESAWGTGGPGYNVNAEFNDHSHQYGVLSMARSSDPNSAGSQFFICDGDAHFLDHQYTAFGHLIKGGDVLDKIANTPCGSNGQGENSKPLQRVGVVSIKIVPADSIK
jgi:peptidyl-prolyl cis-trans isomerase B (cyclophilin B)